MVSKTGLMKRSYMVYSQDIDIVTLETELNSHRALVGREILRDIKQ